MLLPLKGLPTASAKLQNYPPPLGDGGPVWLLSVRVLTARPGPTSYFCFTGSREKAGTLEARVKFRW